MRTNPNLIEELLDFRCHPDLTERQIHRLMKSRRHMTHIPIPEELYHKSFWRFVWPYYTPTDEAVLKNSVPYQRYEQPTSIGGDPEDEVYWRFVWPYYTPEMEAELYGENLPENQRVVYTPKQMARFAELEKKRRSRKRRKRTHKETSDKDIEHASSNQKSSPNQPSQD